MQTTCLINNYNYRSFVGEAIDSALNQSVPFDEVIVVDDGSDDGSLAYLQSNQARKPRVRVISKSNGGQLSAFNEGWKHSTGDLIFFLDADDRYRSDYLEAALEIYREDAADFVIAGVTNFGSGNYRDRKVSSRRRLGISTVAALLDQAYIGGPTSSLSMRRTIAERILPYPFEDQWLTRADDVLVLASSIIGARKLRMGTPYVEYRVHGANNFSGRRWDADRKLQHGLAVNQLMYWYCARTGYDLPSLPRLLHREFCTIEHPTFGEWWNYLKMSFRSKLPLKLRTRHLLKTTAHYWGERFASAEPTPARGEAAFEPTIIPISSPVEKRRLAA